MTPFPLEGIAEATLRRAKAREGLEAIRLDNSWWWRYPPEEVA